MSPFVSFLCFLKCVLAVKTEPNTLSSVFHFIVVVIIIIIISSSSSSSRSSISSSSSCCY